MSSNAALQKVRWLFNAAKGGHTGTLDPLATGLLPICLGEATKFSSSLLDADKAYRATVRLGIVTDTADAEGKILETRPVTVNAADVLALLPRFLGEQSQVPPMYSALKRDGVPLYELARQGIEVERAARTVFIHSIEFLGWQGEDCFEIDVACSKGTYVRTLAADIGTTLGCGAHLAALRRTRVGAFDIADALTIDQIETLPADQRDTLLQPVDALLVDMPVVGLDVEEVIRIRHGQAIQHSGKRPPGDYRLMTPEGFFIGIGQMRADGWLQPKRLISP